MGAECSRCGRDIYDECGHCAVVDERDAYRKAIEQAIDELVVGDLQTTYAVLNGALDKIDHNEEDK